MEHIVQVRPILSEQLDIFVELTDHPEDIQGFKERLEDLWASGRSKPEWCFLAWEGKRPTGRVGYRAFVPGSGDFSMMALKLPWEVDVHTVGEALLRESFRHLAEQGARTVERRLFAHWDFIDEQRELFTRAGMRLVQEKRAFIWNHTRQPRIAAPERLVYQALPEAGEQAFLQVIQRAGKQSLDRLERSERERLGIEQAAREQFELLRSFDHLPEWWQLAFRQDGALVGYVAPVLLAEEEGSIGYLGVVPEQRGRGYGTDLLQKGAALLQDFGVPEIYCDADSENRPVVDAFRRTNFEEDPLGHVWVYEKALA